MNSAQRDQYLDAMGVQVWLEKSKPIAAVSQVVSLEENTTVISLQGHDKARLVVVADVNSNEAEVLLGNILQAIGQNRQNIQVIKPVESSAFNQQQINTQADATLIMGKAATEFFAGNAIDWNNAQKIIHKVQNTRAIVTHSLDDLLQEPSLKRDAWQSLQLISPFLVQSR